MIDRHVRCLGVGIREGHPGGVFDNHPRSYRRAHIGLGINSRSPFKEVRYAVCVLDLLRVIVLI
jgi:hypothetical protein